MRPSRRAVALGVGALLLAVGPSAYLGLAARGFPPDTTPEGAYLRVVLAVNDDKLQAAFAYLETEAQWAVFSALEYERKMAELVAGSYPEPERARLLAELDDARAATGGPDYFARLARRLGFTARLRRDLSGILRVEIVGERATVETARGTRYALRRRENGIWGLTMFTAELRARAERASRDVVVVERAAADYRAAR
ncbi:MAG: hypothetical protein IT374_14315 [Polyangiaceae bacterium]|nr:hypothetical protein [Polyangiaceae bacterium]